MQGFVLACGLVLLSLLSAQSAYGLDSGDVQVNCEVTPKIVAKMPQKTGNFIIDGQLKAFDYRLANTSETRQHGFQFTCAETILNTKILFKFRTVLGAAFHMRNVVAPLDIAFIDKNGRITDILLMQPYIKGQEQPLYRSSGLVLYALEAYAGFFEEQGIKVGDKVEL